MCFFSVIFPSILKGQKAFLYFLIFVLLYCFSYYLNDIAGYKAFAADITDDNSSVIDVIDIVPTVELDLKDPTKAYIDDIDINDKK